MKSIYVVDDNSKICLLMQKMLELEGYNVITETDPVSARNFLLRVDNTFILKAIFLDMEMPEISGVELLENIKSNSALVNVPVIFLTSDDTTSAMMKSYELGAEYFMNKPATREQLVFALESVVEDDQEEFVQLKEELRS